MVPNELPEFTRALPPSQNLLSDRDRYIAMALVTGRTQTEIARELGCSPSYITQLKKRQAFLDVVQVERERLFPMLREFVAEKVMKKFDDAAESTAANIIKLSKEADTDSTKLKASIEVLDRSSASFKANKNEQQAPQVVFNLDKDFLAAVSHAAHINQHQPLLDIIETTAIPTPHNETSDESPDAHWSPLDHTEGT